jgi:hypothetical protein
MIGKTIGHLQIASQLGKETPLKVAIDRSS